MPDVATHPAVIAAAVAAAVLIIASAALPKIAEPIGHAIDGWLERRRAAAVASDDADIAERDRQIAYLQGVAAERMREIRERDRLAAHHMPWDWERYRAAVKAGHEVDIPPPLIPDIPPPPHPHID